MTCRCGMRRFPVISSIGFSSIERAISASVVILSLQQKKELCRICVQSWVFERAICGCNGLIICIVKHHTITGVGIYSNIISFMFFAAILYVPNVVWP